MPISFTPISAGLRWHGSTWAVEDEHELAWMLARVAIGQFSIVEKILHETGCAPGGMATSGFEGAKRLLTVPAGSSPAHRDGWMFQVISWIASHLQAHQADQKALIQPPHLIHAQKGQDGLLIEYAEDDIARVVICEDKATDIPGTQIKKRVLPDFAKYETGVRDNELIAAVATILRGHSVDNADQITEDIFWDNKRAYRIAVTVPPNRTTTDAQKRLFKGYRRSVRGSVQRRRVELMPLKNLRPWMKSLANQALAIIGDHDV